MLNDFTGYKNVQSGVSALQIGQVRFVFLLLTCLIAGKGCDDDSDGTSAGGNDKVMMRMIMILMTVMLMLVVVLMLMVVVSWLFNGV